MSDSDETNLLLLIPPDFFMVNPDENGARSPGSDDDDVGSSISAKMYRKFKAPGERQSGYSAQYRGLVPSTMDYSFRSRSVNRDDIWSHDRPFVHSTPKVVGGPLNGCKPNTYRNGEGAPRDPVIKEIDSFLSNKGRTSSGNSFRERKRDSLEVAEETLHAFRSKCTVEEEDQNQRKSMGFSRKLIPDVEEEEPLMSLSTMWSREGKQRTMESSYSSNAQEERLRRKHCEQTIQILQQNILEFEQKIAVALKVDRRKDEVLASMKQSQATLTSKLDTLERTLLQTDQRFAGAQQKYEDEIASLKRSNDTLQTELNRTLVSNRHLNECNELLEQKIAHITRSTNEVRTGHQQQITELEVRVSNAAKSEEILSAELAKWKVVAVKLKAEMKSNSELEALKGQVTQLTDELSAEKTLSEGVAQQFREKIDSLLAKEKTLMLELETQRVSLKSFYQTQLDESVAQKVNEFQLQLDSVESTLRAEAKKRERTIAERAIRQMELINQKNEQEFTLLTEKHNEEIDLYRLQLDNAKKMVDELTQKVVEFQSKRTDMAERLHTVMETQWHRALEILASPSTPERTNSALSGSQKTKAENEIFQTPTTSRQSVQTTVGSDRDSNDRVNNYIELLLEKSPRDLDQLNAILEPPSERSQSNPQLRRSTDASLGSSRRPSKVQSGQQPWK